LIGICTLDEEANPNPENMGNPLEPLFYSNIFVLTADNAIWFIKPDSTGLMVSSEGI
jgi:hypothetical protein